jgi:hypothetical protein
VADITGKGRGGGLIMSTIVKLNPGIKPKEITPAHIAAAKKSLKNDGIEIFDDGSFKLKAYGGKIKKKMMAGGGKLKNVPSGNKGLGKLPTAVRNSMGFNASGGKVKKTYAKGGGIRKANYK